MRSRTIGSLVVMALLVHVVLGAGVSVADRTRPFRIGALTQSWGPTPMIVEMRDGLLEHGYREDVDFFLGVRFTQGDINALDAAAHELVQYGVDLMFVDFDAAARAAQQATTEIPIVFGGVADPIGMGLVQSFARPGGNITGVTDMELHLGPKRLQMFKEMIPHLQRVWFPYDAADAYAVTMSKSTETRLGNWGLRWWRRWCERQRRRERSWLRAASARWMGF